MPKQNTAVSYRDFTALKNVPTDSEAAHKTLVRISISLKGNIIDDRDALAFILAIKNLHLISQKPLVPELKKIIDDLVVKILKERKVRINKWDFCHLIANLDSIGITNPNLKDYLISFFEDPQLYQSLPINSKIHFLLHYRNIAKIDDRDSNLELYLKEIINYVVENQELLYFIGFADANAAIDLIAYGDLVLKLNFPESKTALEILSKHAGMREKADPSGLHKKTLEALQRKLQADLKQIKPDEWSIIVSGLRQNDLYIGNYCLKSEYPVKYQGSTVVLRDCDIAIIDENDNLMAIIEIDGPSHFVIKDKINGKTNSRNKLYAAMLGDNFFTISYNSKEEELTQVVNAISEIVRRQENLRNQDLLPEVANKTSEIDSTTTTSNATTTPVAIAEEESSKSKKQTNEVALKVKSRSDIEESTIIAFEKLIQEGCTQDVLHEIERFFIEPSILEKIQTLKIENLSILEYFLQKFIKEDDEQNLRDLSSIIEILHVYGFATKNESLTKNPKVLENERLKNIFTKSLTRTSVDSKTLEVAARILQLNYRNSITQAVKRLRSLNLEADETLGDNINYLSMVCFCCTSGFSKTHPLYRVLSSNKAAFTAGLVKAINLALRYNNIELAEKILDIVDFRECRDVFIKAISKKEESYGNTTLMFAAENNHADFIRRIFELLQEFGANQEELLQIVTQGNNDGFTTLMFTSQDGHKETAELVIDLLKNKAGLEKEKLVEEINQGNKDNVTSLMIAAKNNRLAIVVMILESFKTVLKEQKLVEAVNQKNRVNNTALMYAAENDNADVVKTILTIFEQANLTKEKFEETVNQVDDQGFTALMIAAQNGNITTVIEIIESFKRAKITGNDLVKAINKENTKNKATALALAAKHGNIEIVKIILELFNESGIESEELVEEINKENIENVTPFMFAAAYGHQDVLELFIASFTNAGLKEKDLVKIVNKGNDDNITALFIAVQNDHINIANIILKIFENANLTKEELEQEINKASKENSVTTLMIAALKGNQPIVDSIINLLRKADFKEEELLKAVNRKNKVGNTTLIFAAIGGNANIVKIIIGLFIEAGLTGENLLKEVNNPGKKNYTPLMFAAQNNHENVVTAILDLFENLSKKGLQKEKLLEAVNGESDEKASALMLAADKGYKNIVILIKKFFTTIGLEEKDFANEATKGNVNGNTALIFASRGNKDINRDDYTYIIKIILTSLKTSDLTTKDSVEEINKGNENGTTALIIAATEGHADAVTIILDFLIDIGLKEQNFAKEVNKEDKDGFTALTAAIRNNHTTVVDAIITSLKKANLRGEKLNEVFTQENKFGATTRDLAIGFGTEEFITTLDNAVLEESVTNEVRVVSSTPFVATSTITRESTV